MSFVSARDFFGQRRQISHMFSSLDFKVLGLQRTTFFELAVCIGLQFFYQLARKIIKFEIHS
jgi:16S rRNA U516 pseudouridylate synthase RsuA-like enzyme